MQVEFHHEKEKLQKKLSSSNWMKMEGGYTQATKSSRPSLIAIAKNKKAVHFGKQQQQHAKLSTAGNTNGAAAAVAAAPYDGYFTLEGFKLFMKFPSNFSPLMQQRAYWLASQTCFDWKMYVKDFLPKDLCTSLLDYGSIGSPDEWALVEVLQATNLVGAPFHALKLFQVCACVQLNSILKDT